VTKIPWKRGEKGRQTNAKLDEGQGVLRPSTVEATAIKGKTKKGDNNKGGGGGILLFRVGQTKPH